MSGPRITDAAVEAGARAQWALWWSGEDEVDDFDAPENLDDRDAFMRDSEAALTAALPHIRRAVIEGLIAKLDAIPAPGWLGYKAWTRDWLRAELEEWDRRG